MHMMDKNKNVHQIIGLAVDEVLHASARANSLDNISVVLLAFEPLVRLIESHQQHWKYTIRTDINWFFVHGILCQLLLNHFRI